MINIMNLFTGKVEEQRTQKLTVLEHLKKYKRITSAEAIDKYNITRLSGVIYNLRDIYDIPKTSMPNKKRGTHALYEFKGTRSI